ncbi:urea ABC transporter permease subunit UrtB [Alsobacter sp. R-9]
MTSATGQVLSDLPRADAADVAWVRSLARSALDRKLQCDGAGATVDSASGVVDAITGAARTPDASGRAPVLNLRSRAAVETLEAAAQLLSGTAVAERTAALRLLERRADSLPIGLFERAVSAEPNPALRQALEAVVQAAELRSPDPAKRIAAVQRLVDTPTTRTRTQLEKLAQDPLYKSDPAFARAVDAGLAKVDRALAITGALTTIYNGISLASILFMAAVGLAIIFGLMGVINLAQGEFIMLGAYVTYVVQQALRTIAPSLVDYYLILAIPIVAVVVGAIGMLFEAVLIRHFYKRPLMSLLVTWAISLFLINIVRVVFGTQNLQFETPFYVKGGFQVLGDFIMTWNRLFAIGFAVLTLAVTALILRRTPLGLNIRATTLNRDMAGCIGIPTRQVDRLAFGFGSALAGLAGLALSPIYNVNPQMGTLFVIDSFMVVVLGGVGTLTGTVIAALGVGQINVVIEPLYGAVAAKVIVLLMIVAFLQWRPEGLFAVKGRRK